MIAHLSSTVWPSTNITSLPAHGFFDPLESISAFHHTPECAPVLQSSTCPPHTIMKHQQNLLKKNP